MPSNDPSGGTAVITGAAHGIGAAFAHRLAATHDALVLADKDEEALEKLADALAQSGPAQVQALPIDLALPEGQDRLIARIEQEEALALLINNAGFGAPGPFFEQPPETQMAMLQVHAVATVRLCRAALPGMVAAGQGHIINVSSLAAGLPVHGNVLYGATKEFVSNYSKILRTECAWRGVNVQLLCPGYTRTRFHHTEAYDSRHVDGVPDWLWLPPDAVAKTSLAALSKRKYLCVPGFYNRLIYGFLQSRLVPGWVIRLVLV